MDNRNEFAEESIETRSEVEPTEPLVEHALEIIWAKLSNGDYGEELDREFVRNVIAQNFADACELTRILSSTDYAENAWRQWQFYVESADIQTSYNLKICLYGYLLWKGCFHAQPMDQSIQTMDKRVRDLLRHDVGRLFLYRHALGLDVGITEALLHDLQWLVETCEEEVRDRAEAQLEFANRGIRRAASLSPYDCKEALSSIVIRYFKLQREDLLQLANIVKVDDTDIPTEEEFEKMRDLARLCHRYRYLYRPLYLLGWRRNLIRDALQLDEFDEDARPLADYFP